VNRQQRGDALSFFLPGRKILSVAPLGDGNVNDTWLVEVDLPEKFVLQRLNPHVFAAPSLVQDNLYKVSRHLQKYAPDNTGNFVPVRLLADPKGDYSYIAGDGSYWRLLSYIGNSSSHNSIHSTEQAREIGKALGLFHRLMSPFAASSLADPLPGFHCTPLSLEKYDKSAATSPERAAEDCLDFIQDRRKDVSLLEDSRQQGEITQQVIHGDPKVANFLFSKDGSRVTSLIDLDTVRPGLLLHDIGDCLRSCCNPAGEEIHNRETVRFSPELFSAALTGYFQVASALISSADHRLLVDSVRLISFELGLRFYTDYLNGNTYFKVEHKKHNLFRARIQFALVQSIEEQYSELENICTTLLTTVPAV